MMAALPVPAPGCRGGRRPRRDNKLLVLDGQEVCLAEAARRLQISAAALHCRLIARTGSRDYAGTDVRGVCADVKRTPVEASRLAHAAKARIAQF